MGLFDFFGEKQAANTRIAPQQTPIAVGVVFEPLSTPTTNTTVAESWQIYESWLSKHWPEGLESLRPPATDSDISKLRKTTGLNLPDDLVSSLKIHNGSKGFGAILFGEEYLTINRIITEWEVWRDIADRTDNHSNPDAGIKNHWCSADWLPITVDGAGNGNFIDLDPDEGGINGQVIYLYHDDDTRSLMANSYREMLSLYVQQVISGEMVYSEDHGGIVSKNDIY